LAISRGYRRTCPEHHTPLLASASQSFHFCRRISLLAGAFGTQLKLILGEWRAHSYFYLKHFCLFLGINCGVRFKLPNNFSVIAGNEEESPAAHPRHRYLL